MQKVLGAAVDAGMLRRRRTSARAGSLYKDTPGEPPAFFSAPEGTRLSAFSFADRLRFPRFSALLLPSVRT